jgi:DNA mismatch repair protein MutS2
MLEKSNKIIEKTVREIRQSQADKQTTQELRKELRSFVEDLEQPLVPDPETEIAPLPEEPVSIKVKPGELRIGDRVTMEGQKESGEIIELTSNDALVAFRTVKIRVRTELLELVNAPYDRPSSGSGKSIAFSNMVNDLNARLANFRLSIDVRGYRAEEALGLVQKYIDESIMLRISEVSILHGKGNGILRQAIRNYLQSVPEVKQYSDEKLELGGAGITVVRFR